MFSTNFVIIFIAAFVTSTAHREVVKFSVNDNDKFCNLDFKTCDCTGSTLGKILNVSFNGTCTSQGFAILKKGTNVAIDFQFQATNSEAVLTSNVEARVGDVPFYVHFPLKNPNACKDSGLMCPIPANTTLDYKPILNVLTEYPSVTVLVKWQLQNQKGDNVFCLCLMASIIN